MSLKEKLLSFTKSSISFYSILAIMFGTLLPMTANSTNYCWVYPIQSYVSWIEEVEIDNFNNLSGKDNGYGDYTSLTINAAPSANIPVSLTAGYIGSKKKSYWRIWIDFNNDGDFSDYGEMVFQDKGKGTVSGNFQIPSTASGTTRMRIITSRNNYSNPCYLIFKAEVEDYTITFGQDSCTANSGTLTADNTDVCGTGGQAMISASPDGNSFVPSGYTTAYALTSGSGLVIEQLAFSPSFTVDESGMYTIHTLVFDTNTLDIGIVDPGVTTGFDVNGLLVQGGGAICASLDVAGAPVMVEIPDAGTLTANSFNQCTDTVLLSATPNGDMVVPAGYSRVFVLTSGAGLVIEQAGGMPEFEVTDTGSYTIHTLIFDTNTLDLGIVVPGTTTGFDVNGLIVQGGGTICASLDVAGAQFHVGMSPDAGTITADASTVCGTGGSAMISATPDGNSSVPKGYTTAYALTSGSGLVIEQLAFMPSFTVDESGMYTIHTLVFDTNTLDIGIVNPGVTTGFDVNGLLVQGGGAICASLDVAGAPVMVEIPDAGTLTANSFNQCTDTVSLSATPNGDMVVPAGYSRVFVLTSGAGLVIEQAGGMPEFEVTNTGLYTIHTLIFDTNTLDLGIVIPGTTTGFDVNGLIVQGGGTICASLDVAGAQFHVGMSPDAGTITADASKVCGTGGSAMISATPDGNSSVPKGYTTAYALTSGSGLVIEQLAFTPSFTVDESGMYTIHTLVFDTNTLDIGIVDPGVTTGFDVNSLLVQGGGAICASLDVAGAPVMVEIPDAGTLTANSFNQCTDTVSLSATPNGDMVVPAGYSRVFVLTSGAGLVIEQAGGMPEFEVTNTGLYTIHTLIFDTNTLDLGIVIPGTTTGFDVNGLIVQGGGTICASLDIAGAQFHVGMSPDAGTITADASTVCGTGGSAMISATPDGNSSVPKGYTTAYALTSGSGLVIEQLAFTPSFTVDESGMYTIHTLVFDTNTLDIGIVNPGVTTGFDVNGLLVQGGGAICASLDVAGAPVIVENPFAGTLSSNSIDQCTDTVLLSATPNGDMVVPAGYSRVFVLTSGAGLVIEQAGGMPEFEVIDTGLYTIHTLIFDTNTLDLGIVIPGTTTGFDVNGLIVQGGGTICASLDVAGAQFHVGMSPDAGTITANSDTVCGNVISATPDGNSNVPQGYITAYVLTSGSGLVIEQLAFEPEFTVDAPGMYTIHTLIFDTNTLDVGIVVPGITTGFDVNSLLVQGGGSICASLDVAGAPVYSQSVSAGTMKSFRDTVCTIPFWKNNAILFAYADEDPVIPSGYTRTFVLTQGPSLTIVGVNKFPFFVVKSTGDYTIHSLVYDPQTLDLSIVVPGVTTGFDVNALLVQGGGAICASLDVAGAAINVRDCFSFGYHKDDNDIAIERSIDQSGENTEIGLSIFPNPVSSILNVAIENVEGPFNIDIFSAAGELVYSDTSLDQRKGIDVAGFSNGAYFIMVSTETGSKTMQFIKK